MPDCKSEESANGRAKNEQTGHNGKNISDISSSTNSCQTTARSGTKEQPPFGTPYWKAQYESLLEENARLQRLNEKLEDRLLNIVEESEKNKQECVANVEYEKSTLMADVNKLSTKLVEARIRLHDYEEKELLHAAECSSPCHKGQPNSTISSIKNFVTPKDQAYDPNLV